MGIIRSQSSQNFVPLIAGKHAKKFLWVLAYRPNIYIQRNFYILKLNSYYNHTIIYWNVHFWGLCFIFLITGNGKVVPGTYYTHHVDVWRSGGIVPSFTGWRWVVSLMPLPFYPPGKETLVPIRQEAGWSLCWSECCCYEISYSYQEMNPSHLACSLVTALTELPGTWFLYMCKYMGVCKGIFVTEHAWTPSWKFYLRRMQARMAFWNLFPGIDVTSTCPSMTKFWVTMLYKTYFL
jgi:hypothetical protein